MKGHIRKRNGKWRYILYYQDESGKNKQIERVVEGTKKDCERALRKAINDYESGIRYTADTLGAAFEDYLALCKNNLRYGTYERYKGLYRTYVRDVLSEKKLMAITVKDCVNLLENAKCSGTTKGHIYTLLKTFYKHCERLRMVTYNPLDYVARPKRTTKQFEVLSVEEYKRIITFCKEKAKEDYTLYIFFVALSLELETGLRRGELAGLTWENVNLDENFIEIKGQLMYINGHTYYGEPKTEKGKRQLYISDTVCDILRAYRFKQKQDFFYYQSKYYKNVFDGVAYDFVFVWEHGEVVHPLWYYKKLKKVLALCGITKNIRFHDLRHTNATMLLQSGIDIKTLQTRLGHADISTTLNVYVHSDMEQQKKAIKGLKEYIN